MKTKIKQLTLLLDLIFPPVCFSCRTRISEGIICDSCRKQLVWLKNVCDYCGAALRGSECSVCSREEFAFDKARSVFPFNQVIQSFIHNLKYEEMKKVADFLGNLAVEYCIDTQPFPKVDIIAPVPLHKVKKRQRGYNQSELLTYKIATALGITHIPDLIIRTRFTQTQTQLGRKQRQNNVKGAFKLNSRYNVRNMNVLILDDVFTTGSTLNSVSQVLKEEMVSKVFALTLARA
jgi:ComF family protein